MNDFSPKIQYVSSKTGQVALLPPRKEEPEICDANYDGLEECDFVAKVNYCASKEKGCNYTNCVANIKDGTRCQRPAAYDIVTSSNTIGIPTYCKQHAKIQLTQVPNKSKLVVPKLDVSEAETWIRQNGYTDLFNMFQARLRLSNNPI